MKREYEMVVLSFINKKGENKTVRFPLDQMTVEMTKRLNSFEREKYLVEYYHEICKEQHYRRKNILLSSLDNKIQLVDNNDVEMECVKKKMVKEIINSIKEERDRKVVIGFYLESKTKVEIAKEMGLTEAAIRKRLNRVIKTLKREWNIALA